jgi:hypothetical protein
MFSNCAGEPLTHDMKRVLGLSFSLPLGLLGCSSPMTPEGDLPATMTDGGGPTEGGIFQPSNAHADEQGSKSLALGRCFFQFIKT